MNTSTPGLTMSHTSNPVSRRDFIARAALASSTAALSPWAELVAAEPRTWPPPIAVFSKVYQTLKLDFDESAAVTSEAGLDGVDCAARPGGEVLPERASDDLPRYAEALRKRNARLLLLATGILGVTTPHTETLLRTAKKLGVHYYRLGQWMYSGERIPDTLRREIKAQLKDLAALNREIGVCAVFQNHSPGSRKIAGGDLGELYDIVEGFSPDQVAVAFDIGHALIVHGDDWGAHFERLKPYLKVVYVKDASRAKRFVPFGEGGIPQTDFFKRLKAAGYAAPISMHVEFDWDAKGASRTRASLVKALRQSQQVLKGWLASA
jgi:sugar phosphate isomerase/epimerase